MKNFDCNIEEQVTVNAHNKKLNNNFKKLKRMVAIEVPDF
jgi:hypothetical protein